MKVLLVEPSYYTKYPPLGLMKLASYHRSHGNAIKLIRGLEENIQFNPDIIEITSLFTYGWKPVHESIEYYHKLFPNARINVGGIYASLMPERIKSFFPFAHIHVGLHQALEKYMPDYEILNHVKKWKDWDSSILFTSRGCIRKCPFCMVPKIEGKIRSIIDEIQYYIHPSHKKVILWDNNFLASPKWKKMALKLKDLDLQVDLNQGIDARLINEESAILLADLRMPIIRLAFDDIKDEKSITKAINLLHENGFSKRKIFLYVLYNFYDSEKNHGDTSETFFYRLLRIAELGCVSYPMRYVPLDSLVKNSFKSPLWKSEELEMIPKTRRVIGYGGAFPPYEGLVKKFQSALDFYDAFSLFPDDKNRKPDSYPVIEERFHTKNEIENQVKNHVMKI